MPRAFIVGINRKDCNKNIITKVLRIIYIQYNYYERDAYRRIDGFTN